MIGGVPADFDFSDVRGMASVVDQIAEAVGKRRPVLLSGPPGVGKTMLARRVVTILPPMTDRERDWILAELRAIAEGREAFPHRPFRAPHHTVNEAALGGGASVKALLYSVDSPHKPVGHYRRTPATEADLARFGVLFLDELHEFRLATLEALGRKLRRMGRTAPLIIASAIPCGCGWHGVKTGSEKCGCTPESVDRHRAHLIKAMRALGLDFVHVEPPLLSLAAMRDEPPGESSASLRGRYVPCCVVEACHNGTAISVRIAHDLDEPDELWTYRAAVHHCKAEAPKWNGQWFDFTDGSVS